VFKMLVVKPLKVVCSFRSPGRVLLGTSQR